MAKAEKICAVCGATFTGGAAALYCPSCKRTRRNEMRKKYRRDGNGLGTIAICPSCGKPYTIERKHQRQCNDCKESNPPLLKSDVVGVSWIKGTQKWRASLGKNVLGYFTTEEEAIAARKNAESKLEPRRCVVCGKAIPPGPGFPTVLTCSPECRRKRRIKYDEGRDWSKHAKSRSPLFVGMSEEMRDRVFAEAKARGCTVSRYMRDLIQKEFDALDKERGDKPE